MKKYLQWSALLALALFLFSNAFAGDFIFNPTTPSQLKVLPARTVVALYTVSNNTGLPLNNYRVVLDNNNLSAANHLEQVTSDPAYTNLCSDTFTLAANQSCILKFSITGNAFTTTGNGQSNFKVNFKVCNNSQDCTRNAANQPIDVSPVETNDDLATLQAPLVTPTLSLGVPFHLVIHNNGPNNANNVDADLSAFNGHVTRTRSSACDNISPGESCIITLLANASFPDGTQLIVQGGNTLPLSIDTTLNDALGASPVDFQHPGTENLILTNTSKTLTATVDSIDLPDSAIVSGITGPNVNPCPTIAPQTSCNYPLTASKDAYSSSQTGGIVTITYHYPDSPASSATAGSLLNSTEITVAPATLLINGGSAIKLNPNLANQDITITIPSDSFNWQQPRLSLINNANITISSSDCGNTGSVSSSCTVQFNTSTYSETGDTLQLYGTNLSAVPVTASITIAVPTWLAVGFQTTGNNTYSYILGNTSDNGNGANWLSDNSAVNFNASTLTSVIWNGSVWLALGYISNDAVVFTNSLRDASAAWQATGWQATGINYNNAAWNGTAWVAVGINYPTTGVIHTNANSNASGNWQAQSISLNTGATLANVSDVAWNDTHHIWVAVGNATDGTPVVLNNSNTDGTGAWQQQPFSTTVAATNPSSIVWNGTTWLMTISGGVAVNNTIFILSNANPDASGAWTVIYNPGVRGYLNSIAWNGHAWLAVGSTNSGSVIVSNPNADGSGTWQASTNSFANGISLPQVTWNGSSWLAAGVDNNGSVILSNTNPDGSGTWTNESTGQPWASPSNSLYGIGSSWHLDDGSQTSDNLTPAKKQSPQTSSGHKRSKQWYQKLFSF